MSLPVLVDTGPLYALADTSDQYYRRAHKDLQRFHKAGCRAAVSYPILAEAYTLVARRLGLIYAHQWLSEISQGAMLMNPDAGDYQTALGKIREYSDQPITLFDAVTVALSERLGLQVWTFDRHFDLMGASRWR